MQQRLLASSPSVQTMIKKQRYGTTIIFIAMGLALGLFSPSQRIAFWIGTIVISALWISFYPTLLASSLPRNSRKLLKKAEKLGLYGKQVLTVSATGVTMKSDAGEVHHPWSTISEIAESDRHIFIHTHASQAYAVPKAAFADEQAIAQFWEIYNRRRDR